MEEGRKVCFQPRGCEVMTKVKEISSTHWPSQCLLDNRDAEGGRRKKGNREEGLSWGTRGQRFVDRRIKVCGRSENGTQNVAGLLPHSHSL